MPLGPTALCLAGLVLLAADAADGRLISSGGRPAYTLAARGHDHTPQDRDDIASRLMRSGRPAVDRLLRLPDALAHRDDGRALWTYHYRTSTLTVTFNEGRVISLGWTARRGGIRE
jgi:hypothetical protein